MVINSDKVTHCLEAPSQGAKLLVSLSDSINGAPEGVSDIWVAFNDTAHLLIRVHWGLEVCLIKEYL